MIDAGVRSFVIEVTGDEGKINAILDLLKPLGVKEIVRTGKVAVQRGLTTLSATTPEKTVELKRKRHKEKVV